MASRLMGYVLLNPMGDVIYYMDRHKVRISNRRHKEIENMTGGYLLWQPRMKTTYGNNTLVRLIFYEE